MTSAYFLVQDDIKIGTKPPTAFYLKAKFQLSTCYTSLDMEENTEIMFTHNHRPHSTTNIDTLVSTAARSALMACAWLMSTAYSSL